MTPLNPFSLLFNKKNKVKLFLTIKLSSDETREAKLVGAHTVVVTEGAAVGAGHHGLHVAHARVQPVLRHAGRLRQQRHTVRLEHHLVALVGLGFDLDVGGEDRRWPAREFRLGFGARGLVLGDRRRLLGRRLQFGLTVRARRPDLHERRVGLKGNTAGPGYRGGAKAGSHGGI